MGVSSQILIKRPKEGFHRSGTKVNGTIRYAIDEPTEYKDITLSLIGKGKCLWRDNSGITTTTYTGKEKYITKDIKFRGTEKTMFLKPGSYENPFEFVLPEDLPSTITTNVCSIKYLIRLTFIKAKFFSMQKKFSTEITVKGVVKPILTEGKTIIGLEKKLLKPFSDKKHVINLNAELSNTTFKPGEKTELKFVVTNDTNVNLQCIETELKEHTVYRANSGHKKYKTKTVGETETVGVPKNSIAHLTSTLTINPELYSIHCTKIMKRIYEIKVTLRLPIPYINETVEIPVVIGLKPLENLEESGSTSVEDSLPSYWEGMSEDYDGLEHEYELKIGKIELTEKENSDNDERPTTNFSFSDVGETAAAEPSKKLYHEIDDKSHSHDENFCDDLSKIKVAESDEKSYTAVDAKSSLKIVDIGDPNNLNEKDATRE